MGWNQGLQSSRLFDQKPIKIANDYRWKYSFHGMTKNYQEDGAFSAHAQVYKKAYYRA